MRALVRSLVVVSIGTAGCFSPAGSNSSATTGGGAETGESTTTAATTGTSGEPTTSTSGEVTATSLTTDATTSTDDATSAVTTAPGFCGDGTVAEGEDCDDGNKVDGDGCSAQCESEGVPLMPRYVFVTSKRYSGADVQGLTGADLECEVLAGAVDASPLLAGRKFKAWLSDADADAGTRVGPWLGDYRLVDDTLVATGAAALSLGVLVNAIGLDETGSPVPSDGESCQAGKDGVWTGTSALGVAMGDLICANWSSDAGLGLVGSFRAKDSTWTDCTARLCNADFHLYCVEVE